MRLAYLISGVLTMTGLSPFKSSQLKYERVRTAYAEKESIVKSYFTDQGLSYEGFHLFIRCFKEERLVEVWIQEKNQRQWHLLHSYDFCNTSGTLGPKRKFGDLQIPEGVYKIIHFNPTSSFYLSLGINYPNKSDEMLGDSRNPGGDIYIHGNCVTVGCIPITDDGIKELYVLAVEARNNGQNEIPVHIFPARLTDEMMTKLSGQYGSDPAVDFWRNLKKVYDNFEQNKTLAEIKIDSQGRYQIR